MGWHCATPRLALRVAGQWVAQPAAVRRDRNRPKAPPVALLARLGPPWQPAASGAIERRVVAVAEGDLYVHQDVGPVAGRGVARLWRHARLWTVRAGYLRVRGEVGAACFHPVAPNLADLRSLRRDNDAIGDPCSVLAIVKRVDPHEKRDKGRGAAVIRAQRVAHDRHT